MPKTFITERDIEDMFQRGIRSIDINENVVLTELAYEKANGFGIRLVQPHQTPPSAPIRPYLSVEQPSQTIVETTPVRIDEKMRQRIRDAVSSRLGSQVDQDVLDTIIKRVLSSVKL